MKSHLIRIPVRNKEEFHSNRANGIGASETGCVLNLNPYKLSATLFLEKVGLKEPWRDGNAATFWGTSLEENIAKAWQYHEPSNDEEQYVKNFEEGKIIRKCKKINAQLVNPAYPYLFASLDRIICIGGFKLTDGSITEEEYPLEIKTQSNMAMAKWESGIPPMYIAQVHQQMIITETDYSEIAIFDNHRNFSVYPIQKSESMAQFIIEETKIFWDTVLKAREMLMGVSYGSTEYEMVVSEIWDMAPRPANGQEELWREFLGEKYKNPVGKCIGNDKILEHCQVVENCKEGIKILESISEKSKNDIREFMGDFEELEFESFNGRITWKQTKTGSRSLRFNVPVKASEDDVKNFLKQV
jgi:putative phage-type endonuclease